MRLSWWLAALRGAAFAVAVVPVMAPFSARLAAQDVTYYRIGAGTPGSSSFDLAGLVGGAISAPPGSRQCDVEGPCGVAGLLATSHAAESAVDSLVALGKGELESAIASADIVSAAARRAGPFAKLPALPEMNAIANVGWSFLHVLVSADSPVTEGAALRGKRVALGAKNSDNALSAQFVLKAAGLSTKAVTAMEGDIDSMAAAVDERKASALVIVDGLVSPDVERLMATGKYRLVAITLGPDPDPDATRLIEAKMIPAGAYGLGWEVASLAVPFTWVIRADSDPKLVHSLAGALREAAEQPQPAATGAARASLDLDMQLLPVPIHPSAVGALQGYVRPVGAEEGAGTEGN